MQHVVLEEQPHHLPDQFSKEIGSTPTSLLDVIVLYPIFNTLCSHLGFKGLLALKKITKRLSDHLATHSKERGMSTDDFTVSYKILLNSVLKWHVTMLSSPEVL
jgi:hypothetical protein